MASKKGLEDFDAVFGEATTECDAATSASAAAAAAAAACPFLFFVQSPDPSCLEVVATDFHSRTYSRLFTVHDLEDLRDNIGIGGSWSEFVDYLKSSLSYGNVKLILGSSLNRDSGTNHANMIAFKSKGLPHISLSLSKISNGQATDAIAKLSLSLFNAFKKKQSDALKEQEHISWLMGSLSSERKRSNNLQEQLESLSFLSKRKTSKLKSSDDLANSETINSETTSNSGLQQPLEITAARGPESIKINHRGIPRVAPVPHRPRVRGASLQTSKDDVDN